jgi:hypothetical protein
MEINEIEIYFGPHGLGRRNQRGIILIDFCERYGLPSPAHRLRSPREVVHLDSTRRSKTTPAGLHTSETSFQEEYEEFADNAWNGYYLCLQVTGCGNVH